MSKSDNNVQRLQVRNDGIPIPPFLPRFLEERSEAIEKEFLENSNGGFVPLTDEEVAERAKIQKRILEKLGISAEVEELQNLNSKRNWPTSK